MRPTLTLYVACHPSGLIEIGDRFPVMLMKIATLAGPDAIFHGSRIIATRAELGRDGVSYRVPGMRLADTIRDRHAALDRFTARVKQDLRTALAEVRRAA